MKHLKRSIQLLLFLIIVLYFLIKIQCFHLRIHYKFQELSFIEYICVILIFFLIILQVYVDYGNVIGYFSPEEAQTCCSSTSSIFPDNKEVLNFDIIGCCHKFQSKFINSSSVTLSWSFAAFGNLLPYYWFDRSNIQEEDWRRSEFWNFYINKFIIPNKIIPNL